MSVGRHGHLDGITQALGHSNDGITQFNQQGSMRMAEIMNTDPFHSGSIGRLIESTPQSSLLEVENTVVLIDIIQGIDIPEDFIIEKIRHRDITVTIIGFRRTVFVFALAPVVRFFNPGDLCRKDIGRLQSQALTFTQAQPVHKHKGDTEAPVCNVDHSLVKFIQGPEFHLPGLLFTHKPGRMARIRLQVIKLNCIIKYCRQPAIYGPDIGFRILFTGPGIYSRHDGVLPVPDGHGVNFIDRKLTK